MKMLATIFASLFLAISASAAEPVRYISPSDKDIDNVARKITGKVADPEEAEIRRVMIKRAIEAYLASPAAATPYDAGSAAAVADSVKSLKTEIRNALATLSDLDSQLDRKQSSDAEDSAALFARRDSLRSVLAGIDARRAEVEARSEWLVTRTTAVNDSIDAMQSAVAGLEKNVERAGRIKDAAQAKRSQTLSLLDQLSTLETQALRQPLDENFDRLYTDASSLLERNRAMIATYGSPAQLAEAEAAVAHIGRLKDFSALVAEGRHALAAKYDAAKVADIATRLEAMYREHGLDNREHIDTVRYLIKTLRDEQSLYTRFNKVLTEVANHPDGWLFPDDAASFNLIVDSAGDIPADYPRFREAKAELIRRLPGSGKTVVRGAELNTIIEDIKKTL